MTTEMNGLLRTLMVAVHNAIVEARKCDPDLCERLHGVDADVTDIVEEFCGLEGGGSDGSDMDPDEADMVDAANSRLDDERDF